jgi:hypothetical protein
MLIKNEVSKEIFRNLMNELFVRLQSTRKRVIVKRQLILLQKLLTIEERIEFLELAESVRNHYASRKNPVNAIARDINRLYELGAVQIDKEEFQPKKFRWFIKIRLDWPSRITETEFFSMISKFPKPKTYGFMSG